MPAFVKRKTLEKVKEILGQDYEVDAEGYITVPLLGKVKVLEEGDALPEDLSARPVYHACGLEPYGTKHQCTNCGIDCWAQEPLSGLPLCPLCTLEKLHAPEQ